MALGEVASFPAASVTLASLAIYLSLDRTGCMCTVESHDDSAQPLAECEQRIGYRFKDKSLLEAALTHASIAESRLASNERLEFLGDAILGAEICERLFHQFPELQEGELTRLKSVVVSRQTCAQISQRLDIESFLYLGKGMTTYAVVPPSVLAAAFESLVAAVYLDGGREAAREFVLRHMAPEIEAAAADERGGNYKSQLQQLAQREHGVTPNYRLIDEKGPDHSKCFQVAAEIGRRRFHPAWGRSKKESEQRAAHNALSEIAGQPPPHRAEAEAGDGSDV